MKQKLGRRTVLNAENLPQETGLSLRGVWESTPVLDQAVDEEGR